MKPSLLYSLLKLYVKLGLKVYFKKWQNVGAHHAPPKGPCIFVANHQNAFLEALLIVCGIKRNPWFLARADVFKNPLAVRLLTFLRIKPVFRFRDGHSAMRNNEKIITECISLLRQGECLLVFAEGDHNEPWTFKNLQRGFAFIALQYLEQTGKDIPIIPVGFHFEDHHAFRSRVLVSFGGLFSPITLTEGIQDSREKFAPLMNVTSDKIKSLILTIPFDEDYPARKNFLLQNRVHKKDMTEQLEADRQLMATWTKSEKEPCKKNSNVFNWFDPLFLYGRLTHVIPHLVMQYVVTKKITDDQFIGSIKMALGIFLIPLYYLFITATFFLITDEALWTLGFFVSMPVSGLYAYDR